jgi:hypothetical protein
VIWIFLIVGLMSLPIWWAHKNARILAYVMLVIALSFAYNAHFVSHKPLFSDTVPSGNNAR